jgi:transcription antitermination factor NusG
MFPSYVFINLTNQGDYFTGLSADGVLQYVKFDGRTARVADTIINNLKLVVDHGNELEISWSKFDEGQKLTITEGPFCGMNCEVVRHNKKDKILVRLGLLQRNVLMELPSHYLVRI